MLGLSVSPFMARLPSFIVAAIFIGALFVVRPEAASFDCDKATTPDEKAICADRSLNDEDVRMATLLEALGGLQLMGANGAMRDDQREWLEKRRDCAADKQCLAEAYKSRLDKLRANYRELANQRR
jgi:uncharacterized protein